MVSRPPSWPLNCASALGENGLILLSCGMFGNTIRFLMPVTIEDAVLEEGLGIIENDLKAMLGSTAAATA